MTQWHPTTTINTLLPEVVDEVGITVVVTFVVLVSDVGITRNDKNKTFCERDVFTGPSPQASKYAGAILEIKECYWCLVEGHFVSGKGHFVSGKGHLLTSDGHFSRTSLFGSHFCTS